MNKIGFKTCPKPPAWNLQDIENARALDLPPILQRYGYETITLPNGAVLLKNFRGLIIHQNRWIWKSQQLFGNTIDFFTIVAGMTFNDTMLILRKHTPEHHGDDQCHINDDDTTLN